MRNRPTDRYYQQYNTFSQASSTHSTPVMVLHNPNNWHWVNKDVSPWAKDWLSAELVGLNASKEDGTSAEVSKILSMDGDVDVSQRKGKVITIFDVRLQLEYTGKVPVREEEEDDEGNKTEKMGSKDVSGTITIPEVAHDTEEDEYVVRLMLPHNMRLRWHADHVSVIV